LVLAVNNTTNLTCSSPVAAAANISELATNWTAELDKSANSYASIYYEERNSTVASSRTKTVHGLADTTLDDMDLEKPSPSSNNDKTMKGADKNRNTKLRMDAKESLITAAAEHSVLDFPSEIGETSEASNTFKPADIDDLCVGQSQKAITKENKLMIKEDEEDTLCFEGASDICTDDIGSDFSILDIGDEEPIGRIAVAATSDQEIPATEDLLVAQQQSTELTECTIQKLRECKLGLYESFDDLIDGDLESASVTLKRIYDSLEDILLTM
jgi:hypothetical protein